MQPALQHHVARGQEVLGAFTISQIHGMVARGELVPTDQFYTDESSSWAPIIPPLPCRRWTPAEANDVPVFYIAGNCVFGPRSPEEIDALYRGGFINRDTLWCSVGMDEWLQFAPLADEIDSRIRQERHLKGAKDQLSQGNIVGAALQFGAHLWNSIPPLPETPPADSQLPKDQ